MLLSPVQDKEIGGEVIVDLSLSSSELPEKLLHDVVAYL